MKTPLAPCFLALVALGCTSPSTSPDEGGAQPSQSSIEASIDLGIPPRHQWENGHGYCGETSLQSIGLHFGAWISQQVVRNAAGGEFLLAVNESKALGALHFDFVNWDYNHQSTPQFSNFSAWMKSQLGQHHPIIFAAYVTDGGNDPDYDHIMPAVGIDSETLRFNDNFNDRIGRTFANLVATRSACAFDTVHGGCIPKKVDYGTAVSGITDAQKVTLPVSMSVDRSDEPNVSLGESPVTLHATIGVSALTAGYRYALLRYDDASKLPTNASASDFLNSNYSARLDFTADATTWTHDDSFLSNGVAYYRVVPL